MTKKQTMCPICKRALPGMDVTQAVKKRHRRRERKPRSFDLSNGMLAISMGGWKTTESMERYCRRPVAEKK